LGVNWQPEELAELRTAVIVNPVAASGRVGRQLDDIMQHVGRVLARHVLLLTQRPMHGRELVRRALEEGCERIVSVGGDGAHNEAVNGFFADGKLINPKACLSVLSYGTGSDLARTMGVPRGPRGIERLLEGRLHHCDIGRVEYAPTEGGAPALRYFINVADFGAGGDVVRRVNGPLKRLGGFAAFLCSVLTTVAVYKAPDMELIIDGQPLNGPVYNFLVANGQYYGGGMRAAPNADLDSGHFDAYVIGDVNRIEAVLNLPKLYRGNLLKRSDKVQFFQARRIEARASSQVLLNLDGEQPGSLPATVEVLPQALPVLF
jgi:YegS/Rv2252/BmrU family lipid kinase